MASIKNSKICPKCSRVLPINEFFSNKNWKAQSYHDYWCKECVDRYCTDKQSTEEYFRENNRGWNDILWDKAEEKARQTLSGNGDFLKALPDARKKMLTASTARAVRSLMNMKTYYVYMDNTKTVDAFESEKERIRDDSDKAHYDTKWRGHFTDEQVAYLEDMYAEYENDFVLDNASMRDYARKVCKASLNADIVYNAMLRGEVSVSEYKEAQRIFDDLSKSSNFAACRRKPGEASGMGSLGEIIMKLEINKVLGDFNPYEFPLDDVDATIADYLHTITAVGGQL